MSVSKIWYLRLLTLFILSTLEKFAWRHLTQNDGCVRIQFVLTRMVTNMGIYIHNDLPGTPPLAEGRILSTSTGRLNNITFFNKMWYNSGVILELYHKVIIWMKNIFLLPTFIGNVGKHFARHLNNITFHLINITFHLINITFHLINITFHLINITFHLIKYHISSD